MSAFRGKADMTIGTCPLSRSLSGVKQTGLVATHMSAFDPKRTWGLTPIRPSRRSACEVTMPVVSLGGDPATTRVHNNFWRSAGLAARCASAAAENASGRLSQHDLT